MPGSAAEGGEKQRRGSRDRSRDKRRRRRGPRGGFVLRLLAGMLGAAALLGAQAGLFWSQLKAGWEGLLPPDESSHLLLYVYAGGILCGAVVLCGLLAAMQNQSSLRSLELALGLSALVVIGVTTLRLKKPEKFTGAEPAAEGEVKVLPLAVRLAALAASPGLSAGDSQDEPGEATDEPSGEADESGEENTEQEPNLDLPDLDDDMPID